nr:hypothetical protein Iba_chr09dCG5130 [Ipomoea batatas]
MALGPGNGDHVDSFCNQYKDILGLERVEEEKKWRRLVRKGDGIGVFLLMNRLGKAGSEDDYCMMLVQKLPKQYAHAIMRIQESLGFQNLLVETVFPVFNGKKEAQHFAGYTSLCLNREESISYGHFGILWSLVNIKTDYRQTSAMACGLEFLEASKLSGDKYAAPFQIMQVHPGFIRVAILGTVVRVPFEAVDAKNCRLVCLTMQGKQFYQQFKRLLGEIWEPWETVVVGAYLSSDLLF